MTFARDENQLADRPPVPLRWALFVAVAVGIAFAQVPMYDFVSWDDDIHVYGNPNLNPLTAQSLAHIWTQPYQKLYIPLSYSFFALLSLIAHHSGAMSPTETGYDPHVFHVASLALHVADTLFVFAILRALIKRDGAAALGALLYGVHPLQVESVAWISEIRGLLANLFGLGAIWYYVTRATPEVKRIWPVCGFLIALALLCKPSAVVVPLVMFIIAIGPLKRSIRTASMETLPLLAVAIPFIAITRSVQPTFADPVPWLQRPFIAGDALTFYLGKLLWPVHLNIDYGRTSQFVLAHSWGHVTSLAAVLVAVAAWLIRRRYSAVAVALATFIAVLLPVLGLVPFAYQQYSTVADRYVSLALLGPAFAVAALAATWQRRAMIPAGAVVLALGFATFAQTRYWRDSYTVYNRCIALNPTSPGCNNNLGNVLFLRGEPKAAIPRFLAAIAAHGDFPGIYANLGDAYAATGGDDDALACYDYASRINPGDGESLYKAGKIQLGRGDANAAIASLVEAQKRAPGHAEVYRTLGKAFVAKGDYERAVQSFEIAVRLAPGDAATQSALASAIAKRK